MRLSEPLQLTSPRRCHNGVGLLAPRTVRINHINRNLYPCFSSTGVKAAIICSADGGFRM